MTKEDKHRYRLKQAKRAAVAAAADRIYPIKKNTVNANPSISDTDTEGAMESVRINRVSGRRIKRGELVRENVRDFFHFY